MYIGVAVASLKNNFVITRYSYTEAGDVTVLHFIMEPIINEGDSITVCIIHALIVNESQVDFNVYGYLMISILYAGA